MIKRLISACCASPSRRPPATGPATPPDEIDRHHPRDFPGQRLPRLAESGFSQADTVDFYTPIFRKYGYKPLGSQLRSTTFRGAKRPIYGHSGRSGPAAGSGKTPDESADRHAGHRRQPHHEPLPTRRLLRLDPAAPAPCPIPDKPDIVLPVRPGRYQVAFKYDLDTSSRNGNLRYTHYQFDTTDGSKGSFYYLGYIKGAQKQEIFSFDVTDRKRTKYGSAWRPPRPTKEKEHRPAHRLDDDHLLPAAAGSRRFADPRNIPVQAPAWRRTTYLQTPPMSQIKGDYRRTLS